MGQHVTAGEIDAYRKRGYFVRPGVLGADTLRELRRAVERVHAKIEGAAALGQAPVELIDGRRYQTLLGSVVKWEWSEQLLAIRSMEPVHPLDEVVDAFLDHPELVTPARDLVGVEELSLFTDKLNFKRPGGAPFPWHQDTPYWAFGCDHLEDLASVQVYLDDASQANGCLWMIPGTHRAGGLPSQEDRGVVGKLYTDIESVGSEAPVPLEGPAGSLIFFDGSVVHGSRTNRSALDRRALVITYQPAGHPLWDRGVPGTETRERPIRG